MKKSVAKKWTKALRSKKFKQGMHSLHDAEANSYCCLGVLCVLAGKDKKYINNRDNAKDNTSLPGPIVYKDFAGMQTNNGSLPGFGKHSEAKALSVMNDSGQTFDEIADFIDENWEEL